MIRRPMLAGKAPEDLNDLRFPLFASPKLDGIRCVKIAENEVLTRSLKPIPNRYIRDKLNQVLPVGADGEIVAGETFQECTSAVMSYEGAPRITFWMFDLFADLFSGSALDIPYAARLANMQSLFRVEGKRFVNLVQLVPSVFVNNLDDLLVFHQSYLDAGFEGTMTRDPAGGYKQGRATTKQQWLLKIKPVEDSEAEILDFEEMMHNDNALQTDELGLSKRSSAKAGKRPAGTLGKFLVRDVNGKFDKNFSIGTGEGLTQELRQEIWNNREKYKGELIKYKYQAIGTKDAPRLPIFLGFRDKIDWELIS